MNEDKQLIVTYYPTTRRYWIEHARTQVRLHGPYARRETVDRKVGRLFTQGWTWPDGSNVLEREELL